MKSKEEILVEAMDRNNNHGDDKYTMVNLGYWKKNSPKDLKAVLEAMEEYARQKAHEALDRATEEAKVQVDVSGPDRAKKNDIVHRDGSLLRVDKYSILKLKERF